MEAYSQEISTKNKALFLFLLEQSHSMAAPMGGSSCRKMDELAVAVDNWLNNIAIRSTRTSGIRDWFDIGMIGYRTDQQKNSIVESPFVGNLKGQTLVSIVDVYNNPRLEKRIQKFYDEDSGEEILREVEVPRWIEPKAEGRRPICSAFRKAFEIVKMWIGKNPQSFPPMVIHFTDGENQEAGNPLAYAEALRSLRTQNGNVLLMNCHLSGAKARPIMFPHCEDELPKAYGRTLFKMSSEVPEWFRRHATESSIRPGTRLMAFNADAESLVRFFDFRRERPIGFWL